MQPEVQQSYESTRFKMDLDVKLYLICKVVRKKEVQKHEETWTSSWLQIFFMSIVGTPMHLILTASANFQWLWITVSMLWVKPSLPETKTIKVSS